MMHLPPVRSAVHLKDADALLAEQAHDRIDQRQNQRIGRSLSQRKVEIQIGFNISLGLQPLPVHHGNGFPHHGQLPFLNSCGRQPSDLRLQNLSHFFQVNGVVGLPQLDHQVQRLPNRPRSSVGDECSTSGIRLHQTLLVERLNRFAYRRPAHAKTHRQLALGRQLVAGLQRPLQNRIFNLLNNLFVKPRGSHRFIHRSLPNSGPRPAWIGGDHATPRTSDDIVWLPDFIRCGFNLQS